MRRRTYAELESALRTAEHDASLLGKALNHVINSKPDAVERVKDGDCKYTLALYGSTRADGGIVLCTYRAPKQTPYTVAHYLDTMHSDYAHIPTELGVSMATALGRLTTTRNRILFAPDDTTGKQQRQTASSTQNCREGF